MNHFQPDFAAAVISRDAGLDPDDPASPFELLLDGRRAGSRGALLTIVNIEGGAPRAVGTHMAVLDDGRFCGYVSGGCVEPAVAAEALNVLRSGHDEVLRFGLKSRFFDIQLPCGGGIDVHVHIRPSPDMVSRALTNLRSRRAFEIALNPAKGVASIVGPDTPADGRAFIRRYRPATRLVLIGQGNELAVMASVARAGGIETAAYAAGGAAMDAATRVRTPIAQISAFDANAMAIDPWTAVVFLFHDHAQETELLKAVLKSPAFYVGALGSRRTHSQRTARLLEAGVPHSAIDKIRAPIGLIERTREAMPLAFSVLADITRERMLIEAESPSA